MELNIPENFFEGEIRDGFYVDRMMKKNWACQIKVLAEIDRVCKKHGIQYFADWGTLLGTVRHKGFVPWDDDMDIGMLRPDYEKFRAVAAGEFPKGWDLLNIYDHKDWRSQLQRLVTGRTVRYDNEHLKEFYGFPYITGIDIFPYDYAPPLGEENEYIREVEKIILNLIKYYGSDKHSAEECEDLLIQVEQMCAVKVDRNDDIVNQLYKLVDKLSQMYSAEEATHIALLPKHANIRKECYSEMVLMDFEYIKIPVPIGYEEILDNKYKRHNWRIPELVRSSHDYPYYRRQQRMEWDKLQNL
jgi:lipopolysaccharide cholinephosphotransferase